MREQTDTVHNLWLKVRGRPQAHGFQNEAWMHKEGCSAARVCIGIERARVVLQKEIEQRHTEKVESRKVGS